MKEFFKRAGIFALINAILIGLMKLVTPLVIDGCIIYSSLFCIAVGLLWVMFDALKKHEKPNLSEMWGAAIFGTLVAGFIIYGLHLII